MAMMAFPVPGLGALCVLCELCVSVVERRSPLVITNRYGRSPPQRHRARGRTHRGLDYSITAHETARNLIYANYERVTRIDSTFVAEVPSSHVSVVGRQINQPRIGQGPADSEVVQILILQAGKAKHAVHHVIEEAANAAALKS